MKKLSLFLMLVMLGFGIMVPHTTQAATASLTTAPCEGTPGGTNARSADGGTCGLGPEWNARIAVAPYAQVVGGNSYTFIGITHPSLATSHTSIGLVVEALGMTTVPNTKTGRAAVFTVDAGTTHRVFIVNQSHPTINLANSAFTDTKTHLITTTDAGNFGSVKVWSVGTSPELATPTTDRPGAYTGGSLTRLDNVSQVSMWGVVYQTSNGAGFAMEFVGDMHDSTVGGSDVLNDAQGRAIFKSNTSGAGRGVN